MNWIWPLPSSLTYHMLWHKIGILYLNFKWPTTRCGLVALYTLCCTPQRSGHALFSLLLWDRVDTWIHRNRDCIMRKFKPEKKNPSTKTRKWTQSPTANQELFAIETCWERENLFSPIECCWVAVHTPGQVPWPGIVGQHKTDFKSGFLYDFFVLFWFFCQIGFVFIWGERERENMNWGGWGGRKDL